MNNIVKFSNNQVPYGALWNLLLSVLGDRDPSLKHLLVCQNMVDSISWPLIWVCHLMWAMICLCIVLCGWIEVDAVRVELPHQDIRVMRLVVRWGSKVVGPTWAFLLMLEQRGLYLGLHWFAIQTFRVPQDDLNLGLFLSHFHQAFKLWVNLWDTNVISNLRSVKLIKVVVIFNGHISILMEIPDHDDFTVDVSISEILRNF